MSTEIERGKKPVSVTLTPAVMSMVGGIFMMVLVATVYVMRVSDKLQEMSATMEKVNARVELTLKQSADNSQEISRLQSQIVEQQRIDSLKETMKRR